MVHIPHTPCSGCTTQCARVMQVCVVTRLFLGSQLHCAVPCSEVFAADKPSAQLTIPSTCAQANKLFVKGHLTSLGTLRQYRVALAPLRFGAGLKGKVVDSWAHGLPVYT